MYSTAWNENFHLPKFRPGQDTALTVIADQLDKGTKYIVAELPTGVGKSPMAMALARCAKTAYVVTSQNVLLDQYMGDFGSELALIRGRGNYECDRYGTCDEGALSKCGTKACPYKIARDLAVEAPIALTNSTYFALACPGEPWVRRELAILDEAHNLPGEVMNLTSFELSDKSLSYLQIGRRIPVELMCSPEVAIEPLREYLQELLEEVEYMLDTNQGEVTVDGRWLDKLGKLKGKLLWFLNSCEAGVTWVVDWSPKQQEIIARPLDTEYFAQNMFFASQATQYVLQSATIVDFKRYAQELGLSGGYRVQRQSPFDPAKSPIHLLNVGSMNYDNIDTTLPKVVKAVTDILEQRPTQKGLVHTVSYKVQKALQDTLSWNPRCIFPDSKGRATAIQRHFTSKEPTVLFSPSMTEGLDGRGDLLRFQIICKIPYPSLGDRRVKLKMARDSGWYTYQAAKTLIQAKGRGMRGEDDWCDTYILDSGFSSFAARANLPPDFTRCIRK